MKRLTIELPGEMAALVSDLLLGLEAGAVSEEQREHREPLIHAYFKEETDIAGIITNLRSSLRFLAKTPRRCDSPPDTSIKRTGRVGKPI